MSDENTLPATLLPATLLPAIPTPEAFQEIFSENCEGVQPQFEAISIPTSGGIAFTITNEEGEQDVHKELRAIILDHYPARAYWPESFSGGAGTPPECSSLDAVHGSLPRDQGGAYGECKTCIFAQWGSEVKNGTPGRGQACKKMHRIFILLEGQQSIFPYMLVLPPTSSEGRYDGSFSTYTVKLAGRMKKLSEIQTKIKLATDRNKDGISYSKAQFFLIGDIPEGDRTKVNFLKSTLKNAMRQKPIATEEKPEGVPF